MELATSANSSPVPPDTSSSSPGEQQLPRSRSSKRRRARANYAAIAVTDPGREGADYTMMPTVGDGPDEGGYRTLPSDDGEYRSMTAEADYGEMPAVRTRGYGQVGTSSSQGTYTELKRTKPMSSPGADYAAGELELSEL